MLLYFFTVRYSTVPFYTILRFPGQSFAVRASKIVTTTFKTPHPNSVEKWYPHIHINNIRHLTQMENLYEKLQLDSYRKLVQYLMGK